MYSDTPIVRYNSAEYKNDLPNGSEELRGNEMALGDELILHGRTANDRVTRTAGAARSFLPPFKVLIYNSGSAAEYFACIEESPLILSEREPNLAKNHSTVDTTIPVGG